MQSEVRVDAAMRFLEVVDILGNDRKEDCDRQTQTRPGCLRSLEKVWAVENGRFVAGALASLICFDPVF